MDSRNIKSILQNALEDEAPSLQINLLPAVRSLLAAGKQASHQQGERMAQVRTKKLAYSLFAIAAILAIVLATPQGRAFAQSVLQLFTRTNSNTFDLEPSQIAAIETVRIASETAQVESTAISPSPFISVAEAEAQVGFDVIELPSVPPGLKYLGARLYGNVVSIEYEALGSGGNLSITQSQDGFYQSSWGDVPADIIITPVKIGNVNGEFVKGTFVLYPNETVATWNPDASIWRLRWIKDGIWFEITKFGNVKSIEYLDQDGMIELAKSLQ